VTNFIRKCSLSVGGLTIIGGTREQTLRIRFKITQRTTQSPGIANIFVTNLSSRTAESVKGPEFSQVSFAAGYEDGLFGTIFQGTTRQTRIGKDNPVDTYLNVIAADEMAYNWATINKSLPPGSTGNDVFNALAEAMKQYSVSIGFQPSNVLQKLQYPRALAFFGPAREYLRTLSHSINATWSIQNGRLQMVPVGQNVPGGPWEINVRTGMVGMPVQTIQGIIVRSLINPNIRVDQIIHLNNADIQSATLDFSNQGQANNALIPQTDADGLYRVLMIEWNGDTRGQDWYMDMWCVGQNDAIPAALAKTLIVQD
jgi:hypothetical protein